MSDQAVQPTSARELRRQIRQWRRGRADARLIDVLGDAYVAIFSTLVIGSMLTSLLVQTGSLTAKSCSVGTCQSARFWAPWLITLAALIAIGTLARMFGPVFVSAATSSWVLATPVRRRSFLVGPLVMITVISAGIVGATALASSLIAGFGRGGVIATTAGAIFAAITLVGLWAKVQAAGSPRLIATALTWIPGLILEAALILTWLGDLHPHAIPEEIDPLGWSILAALGVLGIVALASAVRGLERIRSRDLAAGGQLGAALFGALATLDLALIYDVMVAQRCRRLGSVRSRRRGPQGLGALIWLDVTRLRRSPSRFLLLLAAVPIAYAAKALGAGEGTAIIAVITGFLASLPLLVGLRVLTRTPGLARMLPFTAAQSRAAALVVPGCCLLIYSVLLLPASPYPVPVMLAALASCTRWVTARPPNYGRPLVSTPAGGVPATLYGSILRGFDVALLASLPLLIPHDGSVISMVISAVVLMILINRQPAS